MSGPLLGLVLFLGSPAVIHAATSSPGDSTPIPRLSRKEARAAFQGGQDALDHSRPAIADSLFSLALAAGFKPAESAFGVAEALRATGDLARAGGAYREAIRVAQQEGKKELLSQSQAWLGLCLVRIGEAEDALAYLPSMEAHREGIGEAVCRYLESWRLYKQSDLEGARLAASRAFALEERPEYGMFLAEIQQEQGRAGQGSPNEAFDTYKALLRDARPESQVWQDIQLRLARLYEEEGRYDAANDAYLAATGPKKTDAPAVLEYAEFLLRRAEKLPDSLGTKVFRRAGDYFAQHAALDSADVSSPLRAAESYLQSGLPAARLALPPALAAAARWARSGDRQDSVRVRLALARAYAANDRADETLEAYGKLAPDPLFLTADDRRNLARANLMEGNALASQGKPEAALPYLRKATVLDSTYAAAFCSLGEVLMKSSSPDAEGASRAFDMALGLNPPTEVRAIADKWLAYIRKSAATRGRP